MHLHAHLRTLSFQQEATHDLCVARLALTEDEGEALTAQARIDTLEGDQARKKADVMGGAAATSLAQCEAEKQVRAGPCVCGGCAASHDSALEISE